MSVSDDVPPEVMKLSPISRSLIDFDIMLASAEHAPFFRNVETIEGLQQEVKRVQSRANIIYVLTFIGALVVMSGPLPEDARFSAFGVEAPLAILPQQVIAVMTGALFAFYCTQFLSLIVVGQMIQRILQKEGHESWQFFAARFDASSLWAVLITPKLVGYRSPRREMALSVAVILVAFGSVFAHAIIVNIAMGFAFLAALGTKSWLLIFFGGMALAMSTVSTTAVIAALLIKMPYRRNT